MTFRHRPGLLSRPGGLDVEFDLFGAAARSVSFGPEVAGGTVTEKAVKSDDASVPVNKPTGNESHLGCAIRFTLSNPPLEALAEDI